MVIIFFATIICNQNYYTVVMLNANLKSTIVVLNITILFYSF